MHNKVWKWYRRHDKAVNIILQMVGEKISKVRIILPTLKSVVKNFDSLTGEESNQREEMAKMLTEVKPLLFDVIEDMEELEGFTDIESDEEARLIVEKSELCNDLNNILPSVAPLLSKFVARLDKKRILGGKYELAERLGQAGGNEVYRGVHMGTKHSIAIKLLASELNQDETTLGKLRQEFDYIVNHLRHPNVVQYWDMGFDEPSERYFLIMDFVDGSNLRDLILQRRHHPMPLKEALELLTPVAQALDFAHQKKIVHRDLKPENILIRTDKRVLLTDFGLANEIHGSLSRQIQGRVGGNIPYMAPEQYLGRMADERSDIWTLGVILYELVSGYHPFIGTSFDHYMKLICEVEPEEPETLPKLEWQILQRMLTKERKIRPSQAVAILEEFSSSEAGLKISSSLSLDDVKTRRIVLLEKQVAQEKKKNEELLKNQEANKTAKKTLSMEELKTRRIMSLKEKIAEEMRLKNEKTLSSEIANKTAKKTLSLEELKTRRIVGLKEKIAQELQEKSDSTSEINAHISQTETTTENPSLPYSADDIKTKRIQKLQVEISKEKKRSEKLRQCLQKEEEKAQKKYLEKEKSKKLNDELRTKEKEIQQIREERKKEEQRLADLQKKYQVDPQVKQEVEVKEMSEFGRFKVYIDNIIQDVRTSLEWYVGPDIDTDWDQANEWTSGLKIAGGGWRMPSINELKGICGLEIGNGEREETGLDAVFQTNGWWVWSGELCDDEGENLNSSDAPSARFFFFFNGYDYWRSRSHATYRRVFAVRRGVRE